MLEVDSIIKTYDSVPALNDVSFKIGKGEIVGLLGPNGAGKTTLLKVLASYHFPDSGTVLLNGNSDFKAQCGYLSENAPLFEDMTVHEYLQFIVESKGFRKSAISTELGRLIALFSLEKQKNILISKLSSGLRQRCAIAGAVAGNNNLLILDEPAKGLDPIQIAELRDIIRSYSNETAVIISSHILSEIEVLCDRVLILDEGILKYDSTVNRRSISDSVIYSVLVSGDKDTISRLGDYSTFSIQSTTPAGDALTEMKIRISVEEYQKGQALIITEALAEKAIGLHSLQLEKDSLEEVFMKITGRRYD